MPDTGIELGADLYLLWRAGRDDLPTVADIYRKAGRDLRRVENSDPAWTALQDQLIDILSGTATDLAQAGRALRVAAIEYARADAVAAAELERLKRVNGDPSPHPADRER